MPIGHRMTCMRVAAAGFHAVLTARGRLMRDCAQQLLLRACRGPSGPFQILARWSLPGVSRTASWRLLSLSMRNWLETTTSSPCLNSGPRTSSHPSPAIQAELYVSRASKRPSPRATIATRARARANDRRQCGTATAFSVQPRSGNDGVSEHLRPEFSGGVLELEANFGGSCLSGRGRERCR